MAIINLERLGDAFVIHFESTQRRINAYTLASAIVAVADAAKAANAELNPGYEIEVVVEAIGPGSFRAAIKAIYTKSRNLFSDGSIKAIALSVVAAYIYDHTLSQNPNVKVTVNTTEVLIVSGNDRVVVPRNVYAASKDLARQPKFVSSVSRFARATVNDDQLTGFAFITSLDSQKPDFLLDKELLANAFPNSEDDAPSERIVNERCNIVIVKAILERGRRKWEFVWRGIKISAPIIDEAFFDQFAAHKVTIAPGDELEVDLAMNQVKEDPPGIYTNRSYAVIKVYKHVSAIRQTTFDRS